MRRFARKQLYWLADLLFVAAEFVYDFTSWPMEELRACAWQYESQAFITHTLSEINRERNLVRPGDYSDRCLREKRESVERAWDAIHKEQQEPKTA